MLRKEGMIERIIERQVLLVPHISVWGTLTPLPHTSHSHARALASSAPSGAASTGSSWVEGARAVLLL